MSRLRQWIGKIIRLPLRLMPRSAVVSIRSGELRGWRWIAGSSTNGCWLGTYERHVQTLFREKVRPGAIVLDIGANVGFFTLLASKLVGTAGHVHAFEPFPRNLYFLERHIRMNSLSNVTVHSLAITSQSGAARFERGENASQARLADGGGIPIRTASLDDLLSDKVVRAPDFIKMDIEGAEGDALRGATMLLGATGLTIVLSTHGHEQQEQCCSILRNANFNLELLRDGADDGDYLVVATK
jgi:FkbM family methyltransferase